MSECEILEPHILVSRCRILGLVPSEESATPQKREKQPWLAHTSMFTRTTSVNECGLAHLKKIPISLTSDALVLDTLSVPTVGESSVCTSISARAGPDALGRGLVSVACGSGRSTAPAVAKCALLSLNAAGGAGVGLEPVSDIWLSSRSLRTLLSGKMSALAG